jgi:hypothetical protein
MILPDDLRNQIVRYHKFAPFLRQIKVERRPKPPPRPQRARGRGMGEWDTFSTSCRLPQTTVDLLGPRGLRCALWVALQAGVFNQIRQVPGK